MYLKKLFKNHNKKANNSSLWFRKIKKSTDKKEYKVYYR